jgi:cytochrome c-type biogenesis protein
MMNQITRTKENPRLASVFFTVGLAGVYFLIYVIMGALAAFFGMEFVNTAESWHGYFRLLGALFSWYMAWQTLRGGVHGTTVQLLKFRPKNGYLGALLAGFVYGTVLTPCNAPFVVAGIVQALSTQGTVLHGIMLLSVFSIAMATPLLLLGWISGAALSAFKIVEKNRRQLEIISALFLIAVGVYFMYLFFLSV